MLIIFNHHIRAHKTWITLLKLYYAVVDCWNEDCWRSMCTIMIEDLSHPLSSPSLLSLTKSHQTLSGAAITQAVYHLRVCLLSLSHTHIYKTHTDSYDPHPMCSARAHTHTHFKMGFPWHERWGRQEMGSKHPDQMNERDCVSTLQWACTFLKNTLFKDRFFFFFIC